MRVQNVAKIQIVDYLKKKLKIVGCYFAFSNLSNLSKCRKLIICNIIAIQLFFSYLQLCKAQIDYNKNIILAV